MVIGETGAVPLLYGEVQIGDIVCRAFYPFKPFRVMSKGEQRLVVACTMPVDSSMPYSAREFEAAGYVKSSWKVW